jgi:hypothetical protein
VEITIGKLLALLVALGNTAFLIATGNGFLASVLQGCAVSIVPLVLIWFPEELGAFKGYVGRGGNINKETPPFLVSLMGWFFLIGLMFWTRH